MLKNLLTNLFPHRSLIVLAAAALAAVGCNDKTDCDNWNEPETVTPETEIFINEASAAAQSITIDDPRTALPITVSLGKALNSDVSFTLATDAEWVSNYNAQHGTNWVLLPDNGLELTIKRTITAGATTADEPVELKVTIPSDANTITYVLPVKLADVFGAASIRPSQSSLVYLLVKGNFVYLEQAVNGGQTIYKVSGSSAVKLPLDINVLDPVESDLTVAFKADPSVVDKYNAEYGTVYKQLPEQFYEWDADGNVTITAGDTSANADIMVNALPDDLEQYAIGVSLVSVSGDSNVKVKADQGEWLYLLRRNAIPAIQKSAVFSGFTGVSGMPTVAINETLEQWTFEYWIKHDDNSALTTTGYNWLDASNETAEWRKRVYPPQSAPAKLPSPIDFKFWPQGNQPLSPMMQFTQNQMLSASIKNNGFAFMPDEWTHVAFTYDSTDGTLKYYINGVQYGFGGDCNANQAGAQTYFGMTATYANATTWGTLTLATPGVSSQTYYRYYKIEMAQMRLWNRVLEADEIRENMGMSFPDEEEGLEAYWKMDEGSGTTLTDALGKGRDITSPRISWSSTEYNFSNNNGN